MECKCSNIDVGIYRTGGTVVVVKAVFLTGL